MVNPIDFLDPDPPPLLGEATRLILDYAAGVPTDPGRHLEVSDEHWDRLWFRLGQHKIRSFVAPLVADGRLGIPAHAEDGVIAESRHVGNQQIYIAAVARKTTELLSERGIEFRVLKGLATAALDHPQPGLRQTMDADLLVRLGDFEQASAIILSSGAREVPSGEIESTFLTPENVQIDLHHRLFRYGDVADSVLFSHPEPIPNGLGLALPANARLVHASTHLLVQHPGLRAMSSLLDVHVLRHSAKVDVSEALELAEEFGVHDLLRFSFWLADGVGREAPGAPPARGRSLINSAYLRTNRSLFRQALAILQAQDGTRGRASYIVGRIRKLRAG